MGGHENEHFIWIFILLKNKPKMAYSRDLLKMARHQCGIMDWNCSDTLLEIETGDMVWFGTGEGADD